MDNQTRWTEILEELTRSLGNNTPSYNTKQTGGRAGNTAIGYQINGYVTTQLEGQPMQHRAKHHDVTRLSAIRQTARKLLRRVCQVHGIDMEDYVNAYNSRARPEANGPKPRRTGNRREYLARFRPAAAQNRPPSPSSSESSCSMGSPASSPPIRHAWVVYSDSDPEIKKSCSSESEWEP